MTEKPDDLDAVRKIADALAPFDQTEQERILRWSRERIGLPTLGSGMGLTVSSGASSSPDSHTNLPKDIKSFVSEKAPSSDNHFAAAVAYFYRFVAPPQQRKDVVTPEDLQEACRLVGRNRLSNPGKTLHNAHASGLLDKGATRGEYGISTVGENLVAVSLPGGSVSSSLRVKK